MKEITNELKLSWVEMRSCVVATIIRVEGSAYRKEGGRCIIRDSGEIIGILSGGCIEEDIKEQATDVFHSGESRKLYYDFRTSEDDLWGLGLGCNGAVTIWLELFDPVNFSLQAEAILADLVSREECEQSYYAFTVITSADPARYPPSQRWIRIADSGLQSQGFAIPSAAAGISTAELEGRLVEVFVERIAPAPRLSIIGVGADALLLSEMAKQFGWHVQIVYHETSRANKHYFPVADDLLHVPRGDFSSLIKYSDHYVVVMTHNLELDQNAVMQLLPRKEVVYLGVLGSKTRIQRIVDHVEREEPTAMNSFHKLFSPIGLDIGAQTPQEITLSIMAELIAERNQGMGGSLRNTVDRWKHDKSTPLLSGSMDV